MDKIMETLKGLGENNNFLIGVIVVGVILILLIIFTVLNTKKVKKQLNEAEMNYNSLKSIPLNLTRQSLCQESIPPLRKVWNVPEMNLISFRNS